VAGCCEYGDEPSGSGATELVNNFNTTRCFKNAIFINNSMLEMFIFFLNF
jgi:hypothetical protein